jgi:hypothetical protein
VANDFDRGSYRRRDYTGGHLNSTIASPTLKPPQKKSRLFLGIIVSVVSAVVLIASFALLQHKNSDPVPNNVKKSSTIPVYYPVKLPVGYSIKGNSFSNNVDVITYFAEDNKNNRIIFSIQKPLSTEEQKDFDKRVLEDRVEVISNVGKAAIGKVNGHITGSLIANKSWILVTTSSNQISKPDMAGLLADFKKS